MAGDVRLVTDLQVDTSQMDAATQKSLRKLLRLADEAYRKASGSGARGQAGSERKTARNAISTRGEALASHVLTTAGELGSFGQRHGLGKKFEQETARKLAEYHKKKVAQIASEEALLWANGQKIKVGQKAIE